MCSQNYAGSLLRRHRQDNESEGRCPNYLGRAPRHAQGSCLKRLAVALAMTAGIVPKEAVLPPFLLSAALGGRRLITCF